MFNNPETISSILEMAEEVNVHSFLSGAELAAFGAVDRPRVEGRIKEMGEKYGDFKFTVQGGDMFILPSLAYGFEGYDWTRLQDVLNDPGLQFPIMPEKAESMLLNRTLGATLQKKLGYDVFVDNAIRIKFIDLLELGQSYYFFSESGSFEEQMAAYFNQEFDDVNEFIDSVYQKAGEEGVEEGEGDDGFVEDVEIVEEEDSGDETEEEIDEEDDSGAGPAPPLTLAKPITLAPPAVRRSTFAPLAIVPPPLTSVATIVRPPPATAIRAIVPPPMRVPSQRSVEATAAAAPAPTVAGIILKRPDAFRFPPVITAATAAGVVPTALQGPKTTPQQFPLTRPGEGLVQAPRPAVSALPAAALRVAPKGTGKASEILAEIDPTRLLPGRPKNSYGVVELKSFIVRLADATGDRERFKVGSKKKDELVALLKEAMGA